MRKPTYSVEVGAKLIVRLDNGQEHEATADDFKRFGLVDRLEAYMRIHDYLERLTDRDLTETPLNPFRYLVESTICYDRVPEDDYEPTIREMLRKLDMEMVDDPV